MTWCLIGLSLLFASPLAAEEFGDPMKGQVVFVTKGCVHCHAVRGAGGRIGPDLGRTAVKSSFYDLTSAMWNHSPAMAEKMREWHLARPAFEETELKDLLAFVYFLNYFDEPGDAAAGRSLFAEKHCIQCHAIGREGGTTGPRLDSLVRGTPPLQIAQSLWNHGPAMIASIRARDLQVPEFDGSEILDLFAYLRRQGRREANRDFRSAGDPVRGAALFASKGCSRCHAVFGRGGSIGPDLGRADLRGSVTQLAGRMWNHWSVMAEGMRALDIPRPVFHDEELADVFAYLFISRYHGEPPPAEAGRAVYANKGCVSCHGARGDGGKGPPLRASVAGESKEQIAQRMWNHAPLMGAGMDSRGLRWPRFEPRELAALLRFLAEWPEEAKAAGAPAPPRAP
ncbi:MAG TPA: c-type cytochrome [Thermoanaerobaculia bacterium]|nr:c-type cytochrome [Thermoanaerobaculia bacterium]